MKKYDVLVIGGGPAGLSAGYTLNKSGVRAAVYDKNRHAGGLCRSFKIKGYTFDTFAHVNFSKDPYVTSMLEGKTEFIIHKPEAYNYSRGVWIRNPVQNNLIGLDVEERIRIIKGFIDREDFEPKNYDEWLRKQYGQIITLQNIRVNIGLLSRSRLRPNGLRAECIRLQLMRFCGEQ